MPCGVRFPCWPWPRSPEGRILDEFTAITGHHRKHRIRLLGGTADNKYKRVQGRRIYDEAVREEVIVVWEASDRICGKRLKAALPPFVDSMERHGHLSLDRGVRERRLSASAATLDRLIKPIRTTAAGLYRVPLYTAWWQPNLYVMDGGSSPAGQGAVPGGRGAGGPAKGQKLSALIDLLIETYVNPAGDRHQIHTVSGPSARLSASGSGPEGPGDAAHGAAVRGRPSPGAGGGSGAAGVNPATPFAGPGGTLAWCPAGLDRGHKSKRCSSWTGDGA